MNHQNDAQTAERQMERAFKQTLLPVGTTNVYTVLRHVADLIEEEPTRLNMGDWLFLFKGQEYYNFSTVMPVPACGTVACASGWIGISTRLTRGIDQGYPSATRVFDFLGLPDASDDPHFTNNRYAVRLRLYSLFMSTDATPFEVAAALRTIAREFRPTLLRTPVKVTR
jgi:hypothetical protein